MREHAQRGNVERGVEELHGSASEDVRKHLWRAMPKILQSLEEEKTVGPPATPQLPSAWPGALIAVGCARGVVSWRRNGARR